MSKAPMVDPGAGHMVPLHRPAAAQAMISRFIAERSLLVQERRTEKQPWATKIPLVSREWKNGSHSSYSCTPFLHSLRTKGKKKRSRDFPGFRGRFDLVLSSFRAYLGSTGFAGTKSMRRSHFGDLGPFFFLAGDV